MSFDLVKLLAIKAPDVVQLDGRLDVNRLTTDSSERAENDQCASVLIRCDAETNDDKYQANGPQQLALGKVGGLVWLAVRVVVVRPDVGAQQVEARDVLGDVAEGVVLSHDHFLVEEELYE